MKAGGAAPPEEPGLDHGPRLDSWKEIAAYFRRDVRTVRRWEATEGLPIRRHQHRHRGSVYAFQDELEAWLKASQPRERESLPLDAAPAARPWKWVLAVSIPVVLLFAAASAYVGRRVAAAPAAPARVARVAVLPFEGQNDEAAIEPLEDMRSADVVPSAGRAGPPAAESIDPEAYQLYLRARYHLNRRTGRLELTRQYLEQVIERAPAFAPAHAALAEVFSRMARRLVGAQRQVGWASAEASARRALTLDDRLPTAHAALASILLFRDWDWRASEAEYRRALALDPHDPDVCHGYATFLVSAGRMDEALAQRQRALATDPTNVTLISFLGVAYVFARRYDDAIREFEKAVELEPNALQAVSNLADAYARKGLDEQAAAQTVRMLTLRGAKTLADGFEQRVRAHGFRSAERWLDRQNLEEYSASPSANLWKLAFTHARLGNAEAAFRELEAAFSQRDAGLLQLRVDPDVDSLRPDPRFQALLRRIGPQ